MAAASGMGDSVKLGGGGGGRWSLVKRSHTGK